MNREVRRKDRQIGENEAMELLCAAEYGILSTVNPDGSPYAMPLSFVVEEGCIYFHCASVGHKLDNISTNNEVCFVAVGETEPVAEEKSYSAYYESAIVFGKASIVDDSVEKKHVLYILTKKYFPNNMDIFEDSIAGSSFEKTTVVKIHIERITGKAKKRV